MPILYCSCINRTILQLNGSNYTNCNWAPRFTDPDKSLTSSETSSRQTIGSCNALQITGIYTFYSTRIEYFKYHLERRSDESSKDARSNEIHLHFPLYHTRGFPSFCPSWALTNEKSVLDRLSSVVVHTYVKIELCCFVGHIETFTCTCRNGTTGTTTTAEAKVSNQSGRQETFLSRAGPKQYRRKVWQLRLDPVLYVDRKNVSTRLEVSSIDDCLFISSYLFRSESSSCGRAVKAFDSKSDSLWERRFESCRLRWSFLSLNQFYYPIHFCVFIDAWFSGSFCARWVVLYKDSRPSSSTATQSKVEVGRIIEKYKFKKIISNLSILLNIFPLHNCFNLIYFWILFIIYISYG